ncbi:MAG: 5-(carboxyamino)imidazole ribonucleotide mutase [candidate division Zixibacteria bacterium]|nr:5-(carboxyamino)imidazole ribonucleotide mutase [candidate division Zixibacteria bacterium]
MRLMKNDVLIIIGSKSDQEIADAAAGMLDKLEIGFDLEVSSAHRHPDKTIALARDAADKGYRVIICMAGMAAHLPGVVAANTNLPVIGVPIAASFMGLDSMLSMTQMPPGIPVATVAVGKAGAKNSVILAARIIGLSDEKVAAAHKKYRNSL